MKTFVRIILSLAVFAVLIGVARADDVSTTPVGYWKTIDDKTHQARSIVRIVEVNGELRGTIVKLLAPPKDDPDPICKKCTGSKKNKRVRGLEFLWGFKREARGWSDGYVLDPEEGQTYHGGIQVIDGGKRLKLFGYVRVIIKIGRSQVWERAGGPSTTSQDGSFHDAFRPTGEVCARNSYGNAVCDQSVGSRPTSVPIY